MKYKIKEITPRSMTCAMGTCPAVFEVEEVEEKTSEAKNKGK